jgi:heme exporter protein D
MSFAFDSFASFLSMGKHGFYVWLAYGAGATVLILSIISTLRQRSRAFAQVRRQQLLDDSQAARSQTSRLNP